MYKKILFFCLLSFFSFSQVNFSEDISPIIYNNCTECHRPGQSGPMSFTNYLEVVSLGSMIEYVTQSGYMPPWHADTEYSTFIGERGLTDEEIDLISEWVSNGMPQGDPSLEAPVPDFPEGSVIGVPDAEFVMEESYLVEGNNQDDYRVFVFSTNFGEDKDLKSIEFIPGNPAAVHHVLVNIDDEGLCAAQDATTPEYGYECESGFCTGEIPLLATGYVPGMVPPVWNNDVGLKLPAGADIAIQVHYAPSPIDQYDQSKINLFFKDQPIEREVEVSTIVDIGLFIPANQIYENYKSFNIEDEIGYDISILSILPHMHLIGKTWLVYAEYNGDTIPIINIPNWDFNWQNFYQPEYMLKIPKEYTIHAYATYDNTASNPQNPNDPPQNMFWCDYTTCEMFFLPFSYVEYEEGDENIYLGNNDDLGCTDSEACNYSPEAIIDDGTCGVLDDCGTCHIPCCYDISSGICDYSLTEFTCEDFWADIDIVSDPDQNIFWNISCVLGCTDALACNFDGASTEDDGSCFYAEEYYDCYGNCLNDIDSDEVCDEIDDCVGQLDECGVCNGSGPEEYYDCDGNCLNDGDGDGICDEIDDCVGEIDECGVCNGSGSEEYYDCDGNCLNDTDGDGICDEIECFTVLCEEWYECILGDCICLSDIDLDEVCDENDNCIDVYNPDQLDTNNDGVGDECDYSNLEDFLLNKELIQVTDLLGRSINHLGKNQVLLYHYNDGTVIKSFQFY